MTTTTSISFGSTCRTFWMVLLLPLVAVVVAQNQNSNIGNYEFVGGTLSDIPVSSEEVTYSCDVINRWNKYRSPMNYPPKGTAMWSGPIVVASKSGYQMWGPNEMASQGIQQVAETGEASTLLKEMDADSNVGDYVIGTKWLLDGNPGNTNKQTLDPLQVSSVYPYLSSITKVIPSPDWFSGFYGINIATNNHWYQTFTIQTYPWDAGTTTGNSYESSLSTTTGMSPKKGMVRLTPENIDASTGPFLSPGLDNVLHVLEWECQLLTTTTTSSTTTAGSSSTTGTDNSSSSSLSLSFVSSFLWGVVMLPLLLQ